MGIVTPSEKENVLSNLRDMDPADFETLVARLWEAKGWETEVTQRSRDGAIDFFARRQTPNEESAIVQVKRYSESNRLGEPELRKYAHLLYSTPEADQVSVVTTGKFSKDARILALEEGVDIMDGEELAEEIIKHRDEMTNPETGQKDGVSAAVRRRPTKPSLPSPIAGYNWLFSPHDRDRWRNVVSISLLLMTGGLIAFMATAGSNNLQWAAQLSVLAMAVGYIGSTNGVYRDMKIGWRQNIIGRIYGTLIVAVLPLIAPLIYLKLRDPTE